MSSFSFSEERGGSSADLPEHLERQRDGRDGTDQDERPPNGLALALGKAIRQQEAEPGAKGRPGADEQDEFRQGHLDFSHRTNPLGSSGLNRRDGSARCPIKVGRAESVPGRSGAAMVF